MPGAVAQVRFRCDHLQVLCQLSYEVSRHRTGLKMRSLASSVHQDVWVSHHRHSQVGLGFPMLEVVVIQVGLVVLVGIVHPHPIGDG
jgi:hypothetical protein